MPDPLVAAVAGLGVDAVELAHAFGQIPVRCLNQQVVMVVHQTPRMACPVELGDDFFQSLQKHLPVLIVLKNILAPVTARGNMVESIGKLNADWA